MTEDQARNLLTGGQLPVAPEEARLIETHISWVILAGDFVYKIKKPVRFDFLDFSTLEKRRFYCQRELELNNRLTQGIYLEVLPITSSSTGLAVGGTGEVVDYTLKMKRLDGQRQMNLLLEQHAVTKVHMEQLAGQLAAFHRFTDVVEGGGRPESLADNFMGLEAQAGPLENALGKAAASKLKESLHFATLFVDRHRRRFEARRHLGMIVDGHGDLHSHNIFLLEEPVIFDCIEFNDKLRQLDVLDELAFLAMDLDYYGQGRLAEPLLQAYLREHNAIFADEDWLVFLYYKWYRANVRLKVNSLQAAQEKPAPTAETTSAVEEYWQLYLSYYHELKRLDEP